MNIININDDSIIAKINEAYQNKMKQIKSIICMYEKIDEFETLNKDVRCYNIFKIEWGCKGYGKKDILKKTIKKINEDYWIYFFDSMKMQRFMLSNEYNKTREEITKGNLKNFNVKSVLSWLSNLNSFLKNSLNDLIKKTGERILNGFYYVSSGSRKEKKYNTTTKIKESFRLYTDDYFKISHYDDTPTITTDIEKLGCLFLGVPLPEEGIFARVRKTYGYNKPVSYDYENDIFSVVFYANGNSLFKLKEEFVDKFNAAISNHNMIGHEKKRK